MNQFAFHGNKKKRVRKTGAFVFTENNGEFLELPMRTETRHSWYLAERYISTTHIICSLYRLRKPELILVKVSFILKGDIDSRSFMSILFLILEPETKPLPKEIYTECLPLPNHPGCVMSRILTTISVSEVKSRLPTSREFQSGKAQASERSAESIPRPPFPKSRKTNKKKL